MNFTLDTLIDMSGGSSQIFYAAIRQIKKCLRALQLIDVWRVLSPTDRDYTFYSAPHGSYSQTDLFLLKHRDLPRVTQARLGDITLSDHAPITMEM